MPSLADVLAAEAGAASAFVRLLETEQEALKAGNADALQAIIENKTSAAGELGALAAARNAILAAAGLPDDRAGTEAWLAANANDGSARAAWDKLLDLAAEARELNRLNGELIRLRMSHNAQMLQSLLAANRQEFDLYGADGQASTTAARRIIDSA